MIRPIFMFGIKAYDHVFSSPLETWGVLNTSPGSKMAMIDVINIKRLGDYRLEISFSDGTVGERDFSELQARRGPMVEPLKDPVFLLGSSSTMAH